MTVATTFDASWPRKRLKFCASYNSEVLSEATDDFKQIDYIEISDVSLVEGIQRATPMLFHEAPSRARRIVKSGDILISTVRTYLKAIAAVSHASDDLIASTGFCVVRPSEELHPVFAGWVAKSEEFVGEVVSRSVGVSYPAINASQLVDISIPVPPLEMQERIAAFLDQKTAQIDALIAKKQALLERLAEKRQALITQAVTKGLKPAAPMKDSGIDWLGQIPAHWDVKRLNSFCGFQSGKAHEPFIDPDGDYVCVNARFISTDGTTEKRCTENLCPAAPGDILMVMSDLPNGRALARSFLVNDGDTYAVNQRVCRIRLQTGDSRYFSYQLNRHPQLMRYDDGNEQTHLPNIAFKQLLLVKPPLVEQVEIADYIDDQRSNLDLMVSKITSSITALQEYRSALITSAVTGQIEGLR
jgi:type I restriction enzyme S subunit